MTGRYARWGGLLLLLLVTACAEPNIPYDRGAGPEVRTIGVLTPAMGEAPSVLLLNSPGQFFGLVGALVEAAMLANRNSKFREAIAGENFDGRAVLRGRLGAALAARGYAVVDVPADPSRGRFVEGGQGGVAADAYLDCLMPNWGYVAVGSGNDTPYRPLAALSCRLVRAGKGEVLMRDQIIYNPPRQAAGFVGVAPDPAYVFVTAEDLYAEPAKAVKGMDVAFEKVTDALGTMLK